MIAAGSIFALLAAGASPEGNATLFSPFSPDRIADLRRAFEKGDLVTVERGRARMRDRGQDVEVGSIALLDDLSRLVRCLPLGAIPIDERGPYRGARLLVRLERIRLEQVLRGDDGVEPLALEALLGEPPLYQWAPAAQTAQLVRWPDESERWSGEVIEGRFERTKCPRLKGALKETSPEAHAERSRHRARAIRETLAVLLAELDALPTLAASEVALAYASSISTLPRFELSPEWAARLIAALEAGEPSIRSAGWILLARRHELREERDAARALYRRILELGLAGGARSLSLDEESRVRARLVGLEEPDWPAVLGAARAPEPLPPRDEQVLANAEARALYALRRWDELMTFGRIWLTKPRDSGPFDAGTRELLLRVSLELDAATAMAWVEEVGPRTDSGHRAALDQLGKLAIESKRTDLATRVYDRLRIEAIEDRNKRGPSASADEARWLAERARIEFLEDDAEAFAGFIDQILALSVVVAERPLARFAAHREIARLVQDLIGRLTNEIASKPERRRFAALLLEAAVALGKQPSRWKEVLEQDASMLQVLAGPYAPGRDGRVRAAARSGTKDREKLRRERRVRQIGEVVVPRLPPRLEAPDQPTPLPVVGSFVVYERPGGEWAAGAPWAELERARKQANESKQAKTKPNTRP